MRVRNSGGLQLRSLSLVVGHPEAVCPATDANKDRPLLDSLMGEPEAVCGTGTESRTEPVPGIRHNLDGENPSPGREGILGGV